MPPPTADIQKLADEALHAALNDLEAGQTEQADALFRAVLELQPQRAEAHFGLGLLMRRGGNTGAAIPHFANALQAAPQETSFWLAYIDALMEARQYTTASELIALGRRQGLAGPEVDAYEQRLKKDGTPPANRIEEATRLYAKGEKEAAGKIARQLADRYPQHPFGWKLLGGVLYSRRAYPEALQAMRKAASYEPEDAETLRNLGVMLREAGQLEEASSTFERSIALDPENVKTHTYLAATLQEIGRPTQAYASITAALALDPDYPDAVSGLATILDNLGRAEEAVTAYRRVLALNPDHVSAYGNMLFCMSHMDSFTPEELFEEHVRFGQRLAARCGAARRWDNTPQPGRQLRIGFVSGDLRNHAVASFVEPMFRELSGRPGLVLHAYCTHPLHDDVTARLRSHMPQWRDVNALDDDALAALIRADGIDILIDLSSHTAYNRLPVFARKPAPVQVSWLGYPGTTGLTAIDYYLHDRYLVESGQHAHLFTEALVSLPVGSTFEAPADAPDVAALPALRNGYPTFGSFNRLSKISRRVIAAWAGLLRAVPDARLLVAGMPVEGGGHEQLAAWLQEEGIAASRTSFHPRTNTRDYLAMHAQVDICLDTFPYTGGTTTLFALYMGVPTLTVSGASIAGRQTAALLRHHGLEQFFADDAEDFVNKGVAASKDLAALADIRSTLRERSPFWRPGGPERIADGFEFALRRMWERWCAGLPPEAFEVPDAAAPACREQTAPAHPAPEGDLRTLNEENT
jgi:predicted O-linked N-acetylglucosamine transferase (SPINDLY family)